MINLGRIGGGEGFFGSLSNFSLSGVDPAALTFNVLASRLIGFITICAGLWFAMRLILAGFAYMSAEGDKAKLEQAQSRITSALIGILIVVAAYALVGVIGKIFGLDILNPQNVIKSIGPK